MKKFFACLLLIFSMCVAKKAAATYDTLKSGGSRFLIFPFFIKSPETDWGFGTASAYFFKASKNDTTIRTSDINLVTLYTLKEQAVAVLGSTVFFSGERQIFRFQTSYSYYPDLTWGIGNHSPRDADEAYSLKQFFFNPQLLHRMYQSLYAGVAWEFQNTHDFEYTQGGVFDQQDITGRQGGNVSGPGLLLTWDRRNHAYTPSKGFFAELNFTTFNKLFGSDFNFRTITFDLREFIELSSDRVLAMQFMVKNNSGTVPIRNLSLLGGPEMMRGYFKGRYADKDLLALQAEVRQHVFWRIGVAAFVGVGEVKPHFKLFRFGDLHLAGGAGVRLMVSRSERLNLRVDYGLAEGSGNLYVILREAF